MILPSASLYCFFLTGVSPSALYTGLCDTMTHERLQLLKPGSNIVLNLKNMFESDSRVLTGSKSVILSPQQWLLLLLESTWARLLKKLPIWQAVPKWSGVQLSLLYTLASDAVFRDWTRWPLKIPPNPNHSVILRSTTECFSLHPKRF